MDYSEVKAIVEFCRDQFSEPCVREVIDKAVHNGEVDFWVDGVRFISECSIDQIWTDSLIEQIKECYDLDLPDFIEVDWEATADNCKADGMGHHFNSYDGCEDEIYIGSDLYHVFDNH